MRPERPPLRVKLAPGHESAVNVAVIALFLTGVAWLLLHYFGQVKGEFGPETNPVEPWSLRLHGAAAALSLILLGSLIPNHIVPAFRSRRHLVSGLGMLAVWVLLILTGYLLYYAGDETFRHLVSLTHWIVGLGLPLSLLIHLRQKPKRRRTGINVDPPL